MSSDKTGLIFAILGFILFIIFIILMTFISAWYCAGVQQKVWERQGCKLSQWEVFVGAQPIVRNIERENIK